MNPQNTVSATQAQQTEATHAGPQPSDLEERNKIFIALGGFGTVRECINCRFWDKLNLAPHGMCIRRETVIRTSPGDGCAQFEALQIQAPDPKGLDERPLSDYSNPDLLELYQKISSRVGAYHTEVLIERMFEIRAEMLKRLGIAAGEPDARDREIAQLRAWKDSAMAIEREWDEQHIARLLGATLGQSCRKVINEKVPLLVRECEQLRAEVAQLKATPKPAVRECGNCRYWSQCVDLAANIPEGFCCLKPATTPASHCCINFDPDPLP